MKIKKLIRNQDDEDVRHSLPTYEATNHNSRKTAPPLRNPFETDEEITANAQRNPFGNPYVISKTAYKSQPTPSLQNFAQQSEGNSVDEMANEASMMSAGGSLIKIESRNSSKRKIQRRVIPFAGSNLSDVNSSAYSDFGGAGASIVAVSNRSWTSINSERIPKLMPHFPCLIIPPLNSVKDLIQLDMKVWVEEKRSKAQKKKELEEELEKQRKQEEIRQIAAKSVMEWKYDPTAEFSVMEDNTTLENTESNLYSSGSENQTYEIDDNLSWIYDPTPTIGIPDEVLDESNNVVSPYTESNNFVKNIDSALAENYSQEIPAIVAVSAQEKYRNINVKKISSSISSSVANESNFKQEEAVGFEKNGSSSNSIGKLFQKKEKRRFLADVATKRPKIEEPVHSVVDNFEFDTTGLVEGIGRQAGSSNSFQLHENSGGNTHRKNSGQIQVHNGQNQGSNGVQNQKREFARAQKGSFARPYSKPNVSNSSEQVVLPMKISDWQVKMMPRVKNTVGNSLYSTNRVCLDFNMGRCTKDCELEHACAVCASQKKGSVAHSAITAHTEYIASTKTVKNAVSENQTICVKLSEMNQPSETSSQTNTVKAETTVRKLSAGRPRFCLLLNLILAMSTISVGVLGWQLTFISAKRNVDDLVAKIGTLIANQISQNFLTLAQSLSDVTLLEAKFFASGEWSVATVEKFNSTMRSMLYLLQSYDNSVMDTFFFTVPQGFMNGWLNLDGQYRQWRQTNASWVTSYLATPDGVPFQVDGGVPGVNKTALFKLNYSQPFSSIFSPTYNIFGLVLKTVVCLAVNQDTGEKIGVAADWLVSDISKNVITVINTIPYPIFVAVLEISSAYILASSSTAQVIASDFSSVLTVNQVEDPFFQDVCKILNITYGTDKSVTQQLSAISNSLSLEGSLSYVRNLNGATWKVEAYLINSTVGNMLFIEYLNVDAVESDLTKTSRKTGLIMLGVIVGVLIIGILFAIIISRQLGIVATQIIMLKQLKFQEALSKDAGIKSRSFVYELAGLQESFYEMVTVFAKILRTSNNLQRKPSEVASASKVPRK
ncbi:hypothetical protein HK100_005458 [Physocladia obscura]|uniref:Uncharacterized protein n=1 Tax=Physocladia obscura TaxID=109957 RepID=A0AAD5T8G2_9FUNG|nr:hypothetical protein HK100_005458 [Physocladia obscura]